MVEWGFKLRLTDEEKAEWGAYARSIGMSLGGFVKSVVRAQISGGTRVEIRVEERAVKKETAVEKKTTSKKPKVQPEAPDSGLQSEDPGSKAVRVQTHDAEPDDQRSPPTPDHTATIAALKKIPGIKTGADVLHDRPRPAPTSVEEGRQNSVEGSVPPVVVPSAVTIRGTPLKEKNSRAMLSLLGLSKPQEVLEPEVLPPQPDPPEVPAAESQQVAVRKRPAPPVKPATVGNDSGPTATRDWGDVLPIGNPRAKAAEEEREELRRRRLM